MGELTTWRGGQRDGWSGEIDLCLIGLGGGERRAGESVELCFWRVVRVGWEGVEDVIAAGDGRGAGVLDGGREGVGVRVVGRVRVGLVRLGRLGGVIRLSVELVGVGRVSLRIVRVRLLGLWGMVSSDWTTKDGFVGLVSLVWESSAEGMVHRRWWREESKGLVDLLGLANKSTMIINGPPLGFGVVGY